MTNPERMREAVEAGWKSMPEPLNEDALIAASNCAMALGVLPGDAPSREEIVEEIVQAALPFLGGLPPEPSREGVERALDVYEHGIGHHGYGNRRSMSQALRAAYAVDGTRPDPSPVTTDETGAKPSSSESAGSPPGRGVELSDAEMAACVQAIQAWAEVSMEVEDAAPTYAPAEESALAKLRAELSAREEKRA